nr:hypothetical protein [Brevundimonas diminuta]
MTMDILAHRGWWLTANEKNSVEAFIRAWKAGYGLETDVRDTGGQLVISHDIPTGDELTFDAFLKLYNDHGAGTMLALNIKSDGLTKAITVALEKHNISRYFVFDMSIPDSLHYIRAGMTAFGRRSEYEEASVLDADVSGIWWDCFTGRDDDAQFSMALASGKAAAIVSPELHGRPYKDIWARWKESLKEDDIMPMVCTDFPEEFERFFVDKDARRL